MVHQVKAGFIDAQDDVFVEAIFIIPKEPPQERAGKYNMDPDPENLIYRVTSRVQSDPECPQAEFGRLTVSFRPQSLEKNDDDASLETESGISMDGNTSTTESNIKSEMFTLDSYARATSPARSSIETFPFAIRQESLWLSALDIDEPTSSKTRRSSLEWLDLAAADDTISSTRELLDAAESLIEEPQDTTVLEPSSVDQEYGASKHPDVQIQTTSQNESRWGDTIDLDAVFGGSATDLEEDFPNTKDGHYQNQANSRIDTEWGDAIDLDAAFGGNATDLEEEFEEANSQPAAAPATNSFVIEGGTGFGSPNLRQSIPEDIEERVDHICQTRFLNWNGRVVAGGWALAKACAEWEYMSEAARENKRLGLFEPQGIIPQEVSRSYGTSWENKEWPPDKPSVRPLATVKETVPNPCHHINFQGNPCPIRSNTPPEVSLWVVITSRNRQHHETFSRQGVIVAQANKLIDPFEYDPTGCDFSQLTGSELKNAVMGKVRKVYLECGTWVDDVYSGKDHVPVPHSYESMMSSVVYWKGTYCHYSLQEPYRINSRLDLDDLVINKGEIIPPKPHYSKPTQFFLSSPSTLRVMELVDDEEPEARPMTPDIHSMESLSRAESNGDDKVQAADQAQDQNPEPRGQAGRDEQMDTRSDIDVDEVATRIRTSNEIEERRYEVEKAIEEFREILLSATALSRSPASSEIEDGSSLFRSQSLSSVSTSSEAELTAFDERKLDAEIDVLLEQLSQLPVDQKVEDVQSFVNSLPHPGHFDTLEEQTEQFVVQENVCRPKKAYSGRPQGCVDKEEGLLDLAQDCPQPENTGLARIRALEAVLMQEFDFSKKSMYSSTSFYFATENLRRSFSSVEIPYSDVSEIPLREDHNDKLYGPVAIAVGRKASEATDWFRSWMW